MRLIWINNKIDLWTMDGEQVKATDWYGDHGEHKWLKQLRGIDDSKLLPIYYGMTTIDSSGKVDIESMNNELVEHAEKRLASGTCTKYEKEITLFRSAVVRDDFQATYFVTKNDGRMRVFVPSASEVRQLISDGENRLLMDRSKDGRRVNVKYCRVCELINSESGKLYRVPQVLATITNNQYIGRTTIVTLYDHGDKNQDNNELYAHNTLAFCSFVIKNLDNDKYDNHRRTLLGAANEIMKNEKIVDRPWMCLSSIQLETFVAKVFEDQGCHVSSYTGGSTEGYDLVVTVNDEAKKRIEQVFGGQIRYASSSKILVQVKRDRPKKIQYHEDILYVYGSNRNTERMPGVVSEDWFQTAIGASQQARTWLENENSWLSIITQK